MKKKTKKVKDTRKVVSTSADALEAALDQIEKLQIQNNQLLAALQICEEHRDGWW